MIDHYIWAFSHFSYVPPLLRWSMGVALLVSAFASRWLLDGVWEAFANALRRIPAWLILMVAAAIFWLLRERTWRGDALLKLHLLSTQSLQSDPYVWKEPLDSLFAYSLAGLFRFAGWPPENAVALLSVAAGVLYVAAVLLLAKLLGASAKGRVAIFVALLALGSSQLWFGHIENYSLVTAFTTLSIALAIGYLRGKVKLWAVGLAAGTAVSFHPQAIFTLPALIALLDQRWPQQTATLLLTGATVPVVTVALLWSLGVPFPSFTNGYAGDPQLFWTFSEALAPQRLADALNNLLLIVPFAPLLLVVAPRAIRFQLWHDRVFVYLSLLLAGLLIYFFFFQNDLPRQRDWDLYAIVGPPLALWIVYAWLYAPAPSTPAWWMVGVLSLIFALMFTATWVGVNGVYQIVRPNAGERELFARYRAVDLVERLDSATIVPPDPICAEASGCERVKQSAFTMPQNGDTRPVIFAHAPAEVSFTLHVPEREAFLWLSAALDPEAWGWGGDGVTFEVAVRQNGGEEFLWSRHLAPSNPDDLGWQEVMLSLDRFLGQEVQIVLRTLPGAANDASADRAGWGMPWIMAATLDRRSGDTW